MLMLPSDDKSWVDERTQGIKVVLLYKLQV